MNRILRRQIPKTLFNVCQLSERIESGSFTPDFTGYVEYVEYQDRLQVQLQLLTELEREVNERGVLEVLDG